MTPDQFLARMKKGAVAPGLPVSRTGGVRTRALPRSADWRDALAGGARRRPGAIRPPRVVAARCDRRRALAIAVRRQARDHGRQRRDGASPPEGRRGRRGCRSSRAGRRPSAGRVHERSHSRRRAAVRSRPFRFRGRREEAPGARPQVLRKRHRDGRIAALLDGRGAREAQLLAHRAGFSIEPAALDLLVEALGADVARIAVEIEKLSLYGKPVGHG